MALQTVDKEIQIVAGKVQNIWWVKILKLRTSTVITVINRHRIVWWKENMTFYIWFDKEIQIVAEKWQNIWWFANLVIWDFKAHDVYSDYCHYLT